MDLGPCAAIAGIVDRCGPGRGTDVDRVLVLQVCRRRRRRREVAELDVTPDRLERIEIVLPVVGDEFVELLDVPFLVDGRGQPVERLAERFDGHRGPEARRQAGRGPLVTPELGADVPCCGLDRCAESIPVEVVGEILAGRDADQRRDDERHQTDRDHGGSEASRSRGSRTLEPSTFAVLRHGRRWYLAADLAAECGAGFSHAVPSCARRENDRRASRAA